MKKLGISAGYFHGDPLLASVRRLARCGFRRIEFDGRPLRELSRMQFHELSACLEGEGIRAVSINAVPDLVPVNYGNLAADNSREHRNAIEHLKRCLEYAAELGAPSVVCDIGSSTEEFKPLREQDEHLFRALREILRHAAGLKIKVVLQNVPGRRWIPSDRLPPDQAAVVERHVWPWRIWMDDQQIVPKIGNHFGKQIAWSFDMANAMVASGCTPLNLKNRIDFLGKHGLAIVYLANHPGPYNRVWHRALLHQPLGTGVYTRSDYRTLFRLLATHHFHGEVILHIREATPCEIALKRSLRVLAW